MAKFAKITLNLEFVILKGTDFGNDKDFQAAVSEKDIENLKRELLEAWQAQLPPGASLTVKDIELGVIDI